MSRTRLADAFFLSLFMFLFGQVSMLSVILLTFAPSILKPQLFAFFDISIKLMVKIQPAILSVNKQPPCSRLAATESALFSSQWWIPLHYWALKSRQQPPSCWSSHVTLQISDHIRLIRWHLFVSRCHLASDFYFFFSCHSLVRVHRKERQKINIRSFCLFVSLGFSYVFVT